MARPDELSHAVASPSPTAGFALRPPLVYPWMMASFLLFGGDCIEWLASLPAESVDLVITDPAYESLEKHRAKGTTTRLKQSKSSSNPWFPIFGNERFAALCRQLYRVLKQDRHFYLFCDQETAFTVAVQAGKEAGFTFWKPLIWDKISMGMGYHYRARYEFVLFFEKGKRKLKDLGISDVLQAKRVQGGYPTEKPVELISTLVAQSSETNEVVCDPFCGSGATGVAAVSVGRHFAGCDVQADAVALSDERLRQKGANVGLELSGKAEQLGLGV